MLSLDITPDELQSGRMTPEHRDAAVRAVREDGFVVLKDVITVEHLDILKEKMLEDVAAIVARPDAPFNFNANNVQQDPPPFPPYLFKDVLLNEMVIAVTKAVLGPGVKNAYYSGNTALPGGTRQPVHPDVAQLWPDLKHPTPAFGLVVNVPVVDMSPENGSTEIWPGTHNDTSLCIQMGDIKVPQDVLEKRRQTCTPIQPTVKRGSVLIRDIRMWHAGMPNHTDQPRPMIAMIHWIGWWGNGDQVPFPKETKEFFEHPDLHTNARFVDGPIEYLKHNAAYDFTPPAK